jgi:putative membrane-bound dehydrogenase-like protein
MRNLLTSVLCLCALACRASGDELGIRVPDGFKASLYADDALAHDIYSMTIDAQGRVVVAGSGYVKILHDDDLDGRADRATLFSERPASGAHGMFFDGPDLICAGDNSVMRLRDADGDGTADGEPEIWTSLRHPEHGANGIVRGPDGCYYLVGGNDSGISEKQVTTGRSPVEHPRCGGIVRFSPQGRPLDVFAHGFRNPYDLDFDAAGHLFTVDSDGERDHHLPWYAPTRLFDVAQGGEHGWLLQGWMRGWNRPQSYFDNVERIVEIGRGSPTGLVVYRHNAFPERYRGGIFSACWTLGRIYHIASKPDGASCRGELEVFAQTTSDVGFAPCDLAVGPRGDLFVAIGGRRTRGSVFRIQAIAPTTTEPGDQDLMGHVLTAPQPLASWSRARWVPAAKQLGREAFENVATNERRSIEGRVRAIEILVDVFGGVDPDWTQRVAKSPPAPVRARLAWALGRGTSSPTATATLSQLTGDEDPRVSRAAWESLATGDELETGQAPIPAWKAALSSSNRRVRAAAVAVARRAGRKSYLADRKGRANQSLHPRERLAGLWIDLDEARDEGSQQLFSRDQFQTCLECFTATPPKAASVSNVMDDGTALRLEAVRLMQIGLGDMRVGPGQAEVYTGYVGNRAQSLDDPTRRWLVEQLASAFPTNDAELDRELARLLGMLGAGDERLLRAISSRWTVDSSVEDDLHYLIVASLLTADHSSDITAATTRCLLNLHRKLDALSQFASRNWPLRVGEAFDELCHRDPSLAQAVVGSPDFGHRDHTLFAERLERGLRRQATRRLWEASVGRDEPPTAELVALVGKLPADEARQLLVGVWDEVGLPDSIVLVLARHPQPEDRAKFVEALASAQGAVVEKAAHALMALGMDCTSAELASAVRALKQACSMPKVTEPRSTLLQLLNYWTEDNSDVEEGPDPAKTYVGWYKLLADYYPTEAARSGGSALADAAAWRQRLAGVDWSAGDVKRGKAVFERRSCNRCHQVSGHLGPELTGAVARMSRDDLFTAIVDPNLEVAPVYHTTVVATGSGQVYHGLVVYESPESTLLQTGPDTTVRIADSEGISMRRSTQSLMPTGLLDSETDQDISDLYAYLKTLAGK